MEMQGLLSAAGLLAGLGVAFGLIIGVAVKLFGADTDPRIEEIENLLPGANCGACGFAGCAEFARALVKGDAKPEMCPSSPRETIERIAALLGVEVGAREEKVAVVLCGGDDSAAKWAAEYNGVLDCRSAAVIAGAAAKGCPYGCLGFGTCARACPFNAIEMLPTGLAVVHPEVCTGCGKCVEVCPRNIIRLVPKSAPVHVFCSSPDKGAAKRKVCAVACIGCRKCVRSAGEGQMSMDGFLARVNYDDPPPPSICEVCPTGALRPAVPVRSNAEGARKAEVQEQEPVAHA